MGAGEGPLQAALIVKPRALLIKQVAHVATVFATKYPPFCMARIFADLVRFERTECLRQGALTARISTSGSLVE